MDPEGPVSFDRRGSGNHGADFDLRKLGIKSLKDERRAKESDHCHEQQNGFEPSQPDQHPALRQRAEAQNGQQRDDKYHQPVPHTGHPDQQKLGIKDKNKGKNGRPDIVQEGLNASLQRIGTRDGGCRKGGQTDRRRRIRQQAKIEHKQMDGDQRQDKSRRVAEFDQHAGQQ